MDIDDYYFGESIESLPPELAKIVNDKEGYVAYDVIEPILIRNKQYDTYLNRAAATALKNKDFKYTSKTEIKTNKENINKKSTRLYFNVSKKYNLHRYVYGRPYASAYKSKTSECYIIEESSRIYSWGGFLRNFDKNNNIHWFQIKNISESHSMLTFSFNQNNIIIQYANYLDAIAYCIDNGKN